MGKRILERFAERFVLMVSIPRNDVESAIAAEEGGADGIKMHLNVHHYASGTRYGSWEEESAIVEEVLKKVRIPVGILPGAGTYAARSEIIEAQRMGIDFLDAFAHDMPLDLWEIDGLGKMIAVNRDYSAEQVKFLELLGTEIFEATLLPHEEYGRPLTLRDLALYGELSGRTTRPVVVPTQKKIKAEEVKFLKEAGAAGIVIGAVVTGHTPEGVYKVTREFRSAINALHSGK